MNDQRNENRFRVAIEVSMETQHNFYAGITGNLSYGGVFVITGSPLPPGSTVQVAIGLPDGGHIKARGVVRWVRTSDVATEDCPAGCGIAWQSIDRRSMLAVRRFLARQALEAGTQRAA